MNRENPSISIIIPTLNEAANLPELLGNLTAQKGILMELIVSDGNSVDGTCDLACNCRLPVSLISGRAGRSSQLNRGAAAAKGKYLLFIHADCRFQDEFAIRKGITQLETVSQSNQGKESGGHFSLAMIRTGYKVSPWYLWLERKALLDRPGCAHGDQGILMTRRLFDETGPFPESCQILGETRLADRLREKGQWALLSPGIFSSARRFESEGFRQRQVLNAVIMACGAAGEDALIEKLPEIYRQQRHTAPLDVGRFLAAINERIEGLTEREKRQFWDKIGGYVRDNAWQMAFFLDFLTGFRIRRDKGGKTFFLHLFDRFGSRLLKNGSAAHLAGLLARIWLRRMLLCTPRP